MDGDDFDDRVRRFLEALRRLPGVRGASAKIDGRSLIIELHVVADGRRPVKQLVRDIEALASAGFGIDLDHRVVSVAVIEEPEPISAPAPPPPGESHLRPSLTSISLTSDGQQLTVENVLTIGTELLSGQATGARTERVRLVAEATLRALQDLLGIPAALESAQVTTIGSRQVALVVLTLEIPRLGQQVLCGSALVRGDDEDAVARSVLAAVNRRLAG